MIELKSSPWKKKKKSNVSQLGSCLYPFLVATGYPSFGKDEN